MTTAEFLPSLGRRALEVLRGLGHSAFFFGNW